MAKLHIIHRVHAPGFILFFVSLQYPLLLVTLSSAYTTQTKHFINCGSSNSVTYTGRSFVGDASSDSINFTKQSTSTQSSYQSSSVSAIYDTARIFRNPSSRYVLDGVDKGTHIVRLHFFPFASTKNLSEAAFDVSVEGLTLLSNFQVPSSNNSPVVEEFLLSINSTKFVLYFRPQGSSFAFINALEVFLVPDGFIPGSARSVGTGSSYSGISSRVLRPVYRINVGGDKVAQADDPLWRSWASDDNYIHVPNAAQNTSGYGAGPNYQVDRDKYLAAERVYLTAKVMDVDFSDGRLYPNANWSFKVSANAWHLVRAHFCDIVSVSLNTVLFDFFVNGNFAERIDPYGTNGFFQSRVPFHYDCVVQPGSSGLVNISIGLLNASDTMYQKAYLNGLEIMEIIVIGSWDSNFVPVPPPARKVSSNLSKAANIAIVAGGALGFTVLSLLGFFLHRRRNSTTNSTSSDGTSWWGLVSYATTESTKTEGSSLPSDLCRHFSLAEIRAATNNFDKVFIVGVGGFGNVYKGYVDGGATQVAIKRLNQGSQQGLHEFRTEIEMLSQLRHRHLVSLVGFCKDAGEMILVYDYMACGTLRDHLYNTDNPPLPWKRRLEICTGAACGLHYLHTGVKHTIIHRDVKTTNILLNEKWVAKVSDFGLSKVGPTSVSKTHVSTVVKGTFGYLDPEYYRRQQLTDKSDVYSFGVVLFEVLCARPAVKRTSPMEQISLAKWAQSCCKSGAVNKIVDPHLKGAIAPECLNKFCEIAVSCLQDEGAKRPSMNDVVLGLEFALQLQVSAEQEVTVHVGASVHDSDDSDHDAAPIRGNGSDEVFSAIDDGQLGSCDDDQKQ
ncbi:hypothetical protein BT93_J1152 [Corymbia citriodora subsp. variegata]|nr:hypothetical protein BT93_J1152 [Corymbia citriodora subsp. variegata]